MSLYKKIINKHKLIKNTWVSDIRFSKEYAKLRRKDTIFNALRMRRLSDIAFEKREKYLIEYLSDSIEDVIEKYKDRKDSGLFIKNAPIWVCWWTGIETAPPIVKQCVKSIYNNSNNHPVHLITEKNYQNYLMIPEYIFQKMESKQMGLAHFSDYLRVSLLEHYGGLWLDATIFCSETISEQLFDYPFFTLKGPYQESRYVSKYQWVTFCLGGWKGNVFYSFVREAFEAYWLKNELAIDYLFFDYVILLARENCPYIKELMDRVPENTPHRDDLQAAMNACLPAESFSGVIKSDTSLYKLSWRETYLEVTNEGKESVYGYFINSLDLG